MTDHAMNLRDDRHPADSYEDVLAREDRPVPEYMREGRQLGDGAMTVATERYCSPDFAAKEVRHVWLKTWQFACREEDIPKTGDFHVYEVVGKSLIIVRQDDGSIKALHNVCLHRGRKLVAGKGCRSEFKCPYHAFTWTIDGAYKSNPIPWDFPHIEPDEFRLPEARVGTWGGFVFVNFDRDAKPLLDVIGPLAADFERFDFANRYRAIWVQKKCRCNWKALSEAFSESFHSITTHPQILPGIGDANSQFDCPNDYVSRQFSATGVASPFIAPLSEQEIFSHLTGARTRIAVDGGAKLPEGATARSALAAMARQNLATETGKDYSDATDGEMLDSILYDVFPNMSFWAGHVSNIVYRWRPNGLSPNEAIMDIMILKPLPASGERPRPAPAFEIGLDESMTLANDILGPGLAAVFEQDMLNLPQVQAGLEASETGLVYLGRYAEQKIRALHLMIDRYIAEGEAAKG
ncbi:aromatic ring-hydroxylating oxygenase subunit alpha [Sphingopyxis sp. R3-92]|uniref:aromatic ring-hydroxylating oxygenase subunit alpha n=1 Tax=Sphingopyxis sp. R3-92 TaxID=3158553 RepID=UPI003EE67CEB